MSEPLLSGRVMSYTATFAPYRAPMKTRIQFVLRHFKACGIKHAFFILRHGIGGVRVNLGDGVLGSFYV